MNKFFLILLLATGSICHADTVCNVIGLAEQPLRANLSKDNPFQSFDVGNPAGGATDAYVVTISFRGDEGNITAWYTDFKGKSQDTRLQVIGSVDLQGLVLGDKKIQISCLSSNLK